MNISIVVPLFNKENYIERCLASIFNQTIHPAEVIVVDDGSTDDSAAIVATRFPQARMIRQDNAGVSAARNTGIHASESEFIAFLDADDFWEPDFLHGIQMLAQQYPSAGVYCSHYGFILSDGSKRAAVLRSVPVDSGIIDDYFKCCLNADLPLTASSVCIRRDLLCKIGGFPLGMKMGEDQVVWSRLACRTQIAYHSKMSVYYDLSVTSSACHTHLIAQPAPQLAIYQQMLHEHSVPEHLIRSLIKLMHFTVLSCIKNNLILGERRHAIQLLIHHPCLYWDWYRCIGFIMSVVPVSVFSMFYSIRKKLR